MYAVVGCSDCSALWIVEGRPETTSCPRCGTRRRYKRLRKFVETEHEDDARDARSRMLASRQDHDDAFADLDSFVDMESQIDDAGVSDEEYLAGSGLDPEDVATAGERATAGRPSRSRQQIVLDGLRELDHPTATELVEYAGEYDVSAEYVHEALEKLVRRGDVSETGGRYRML